MASIVLRNKRRKRVSSEKRFEFENFAIPNSAQEILSGAFRDNIRIFLQNFAEIEEYTVNDMQVWSTPLVSENDGVFPLYTAEETVEISPDPFCCYCVSSGWGHHFVCKRKYHFIIPGKDGWSTPLNENFTCTTHTLYGLIHCNGYGHLINVDGLKNNSRFFNADDSMEFWDRLCAALKARSISTTMLEKEMTELTLIHGAAFGNSWFEKWGYKYSGKITEQKYDAAIGFLSSLGLDKIVNDVKNKGDVKMIKERIEMYRKLSENPLVTVGDLLEFMLAFESRIPKVRSNGCNFESETGESPMEFETFIDSMTKDCRWSAKRLENVLSVVVDLLKRQKAHNVERECSMSRQELRDEARKSIGDTGLIDFVLKSIKCFTVDNQIIRRTIDPFSRLAQFTIHNISPGSGIWLGLNLSQDIWFLYAHVLLLYPETELVLHNSQFLKHWPIKREIVNQSMELTCKVLPSFSELETELTRPLSPGEVAVVEPWITIQDLKMVVQCALRDTYCVMNEFEVSQIGGLREIDDKKVLYSALEPGVQVWVRGSGLDLSTWLRYEDGPGGKR